MQAPVCAVRRRPVFPMRYCELLRAVRGGHVLRVQHGCVGTRDVKGCQGDSEREKEAFAAETKTVKGRSLRCRDEDSHGHLPVPSAANRAWR